MLTVPDGLNEEQFDALSAKVRTAVAHLSNDVAVHGSRATGAAQAPSDLDIAARVSTERFDERDADATSGPKRLIECGFLT